MKQRFPMEDAHMEEAQKYKGRLVSRLSMFSFQLPCLGSSHTFLSCFDPLSTLVARLLVLGAFLGPAGGSRGMVGKTTSLCRRKTDQAAAFRNPAPTMGL